MNLDENMGTFIKNARTNLDEVEADVFVEGVEDEFGQAVIAPRAVHQQQASEEAKLCGDANIANVR